MNQRTVSGIESGGKMNATRRFRATATKETLESIHASGGDSNDDMTPCAASGSKVANSHEHDTRLAAIYTPEARALATQASLEQAHKRKREASLKSQQRKDEEAASTERIIQDLLADSQKIDRNKHAASTLAKEDR
jgi:hypothetical protein